MTPIMEVEVRHILRKHLIVPTVIGKATILTCTECGRRGTREDWLIHDENCRYARLLSALGETVSTGLPTADLAAMSLNIHPAANDDGDGCFT
jgi:hypothetical protein